MSDTTQTTALTSVFTPPASCSSSWTYEAQTYNSVTGGLLLQNALQEIDPACFPSGYSGYGRAPFTTYVFSPGVCPSGYTTAAENLDGGTLSAVCCQTGFSVLSFASSINGDGSSSFTYEGCTSIFPQASGATAVSARTEKSDLGTTTVTGPITMWAQPIYIQYAQQDLSLFSTSTPTSASVSKSTPAPSSTRTAPTSTSTVAATSKDTTDGGLSTGATAGIAIAASICGLIAIAAVFLLFMRKRRAKRTQRVLAGAADDEPWGPGELDGSDGRFVRRELDGSEASLARKELAGSELLPNKKLATRVSVTGVVELE